MTATSGHKCLDLFVRVVRPSSWQRTFMASLLGSPALTSTRCFLIWKVKVTRSYRRLFFQLAASVPRISANESGLWRTPTRTDGERGPMTSTEALENPARRGEAHSLTTQVQHPHLWPTPMKADAERTSGTYARGNQTLVGAVRSEPPFLPTPTKNDAEKRGNFALERRNGLPAAAKLWPTPKASPSGPDFARMSRDGSGGDDLATAIAREEMMYPTPMKNDAKNSTLPPSHEDWDSLPGALIRDGEPIGGQLNPDWVEWLMGYPIGWTALED